jgi:MYXO-CTERM domain-containing protein
MDLRTSTHPSPPLSEQTPGLDRDRRLRALALRTKTAVASRPRTFLGVLGGLVLIGVGAFLALRRRRALRTSLPL